MTKYILKPQKLGNFCSLREGLMWIAFDRFPEYSVVEILDKYTARIMLFFEDGPLDDMLHYFFDFILPNLKAIDGTPITDDFSENDENYNLLYEYLEVYYHKLFVKLREQSIPLYGLPRQSKDDTIITDDNDINFERICTEEIIYDFIDWDTNTLADPDKNPENEHYYSHLFIPLENLLKEFPIKYSKQTTVEELDNVFIYDTDSQISKKKLRGRRKSLNDDEIQGLLLFCNDFIKNNPNSQQKTIIISCMEWVLNKLGVEMPFTTVRDYISSTIKENKQKSE